MACQSAGSAATPGNTESLPVASEEFRSLWALRGEQTERQRPFRPTVPVMLNGELVDDVERMNKEYPSLYITPAAYGSSLVLAAFTDGRAMLAEARRMEGDAEFHWLMEERGLGCLPEGAPAPTVLEANDLPDLKGEILRVPPEKSIKDLATKARRGFLNWDNAIRSVDVCAYPYALCDGKNFTGNMYFVNFRCGFTLGSFGLITSSIVNWGTSPPTF